MELKRLNKAISETGAASRRGADKLIEAGRVTVNGEIAEMGLKVTANDIICVDGKQINERPELVYLAFYKPVGITCTTDQTKSDNIVDYINYPKRIFPIGRLDKPSHGLIFMTNDGDIVNKILRAGNNHEKEYIVRVDKPITSSFVRRMSVGVDILDTKTLPCKVDRLSEKTFRITLTQGLNRQIRRMCTALGYSVKTLKRVRIMNVKLGNLKNGEIRELTKAELTELLRLCEGSSKTEEASRV